MSTLREAAEKALETLTDSRIGRCDYMDGVEIYSDFNDAAEALRAELVKPDAPTVEDEPAPQMPEALRDSLQRRCVEWGVYWRAPDAHGVDLTHEQALELLRDALGVEVEIAAAPRPAPAEPQPIAAWSIVRTAESAVVTAVRAALSAPAERDGWQLVPVEPTEAMWSAGRDPVMFRELKHYRPASLPVPAWQMNPDGTVEKDTSKGTTAVHVWRAMLAAAPRPAPAEPQGAEAPQEIKSLRDRIIEGELELDGTHPPTLMFLMAEHWKAVATEH